MEIGTFDGRVDFDSISLQRYLPFATETMFHANPASVTIS